jgi:hypothetical protein
MYYSSSVNGFIPAAWKTDGTYSSESWPADAVLLTEEEQATYWKQSPPEGKRLGSKSGRPTWVDLPPLTGAEIEGAERSWRDGELSAVMWLRERHRDQQEIGGETTITAEQFGALLVYMQALRDWPQSDKFPDVEFRPIAPPWIAEQTQ